MKYDIEKQRELLNKLHEKANGKSLPNDYLIFIGKCLGKLDCDIILDTHEMKKLNIIWKFIKTNKLDDKKDVLRGGYVNAGSYIGPLGYSTSPVGYSTSSPSYSSGIKQPTIIWPPSPKIP